jgi:anaerobic selenocysteine-containing dehydrogenase
MPDDVAAELRHAARAITNESRSPALQLVVRRAKEVINTVGHRLPGLAPMNPCHVHPDDLAELGLTGGDLVRVVSAHGAVQTVVAPDATLRRGVVSLTHGFGDLPGEDDDPFAQGANTNRLLSVADDLQAISAMPRMSAVPVTITAAAS